MQIVIEVFLFLFQGKTGDIHQCLLRGLHILLELDRLKISKPESFNELVGYLVGWSVNKPSSQSVNPFILQ